MNSMRSPSAPSNSGSIGMGIDYPELTSPTIVRPPPVASPPTLTERHTRIQQPYHPHSQSSSSRPLTAGTALTQPTPNGAPVPPRIKSDYPVTFWSDVQIGTSGLKNLGNTCYMNAPIQCLSATVPFARFFTEGRWKNAVNFTNPLGTKGKLTGAFAKLVHEMWGGDFPYLTPIEFRVSFDLSACAKMLMFLIFSVQYVHSKLSIMAQINMTPKNFSVSSLMEFTRI